MIAPSIALGVFLGRQSLQGKLRDAQAISKIREDELKLIEIRHHRALELQRISNEELVRRVLNNLPIDEPNINDEGSGDKSS